MSQSVGIYARVSSDRQAQEGTIDSQLSALREYAHLNHYVIEEDLVFIDNGISGTTLVRPGLDALRDRSMTGDINSVLILCPDRLARKYTHQLLLVEEFKKMGVDILFVNRQISQSPEDQLLFQIQGIIAEFEREKILERSRRGKLHHAKNGNVSVLSVAPYGYVYVMKSDTEKARYEIHVEEAEVVRKIFHLYTYERKSIGAIATELTRLEVPTKMNKGYWGRSSIWRMLKNPAYMGQAAFRKTQFVPRLKPTKLSRDNGFYPKRPNSSARDRPKEEWITIPVPSIIDKKVFKKAEQQLQENKKLSARNNKKNKYLLSGLMRCKECGYSLYGKPAINSRNILLYYRCIGQDDFRWPTGRVCASHPIRVEVLDEIVWEQTKILIDHPQLVLEEYSRRKESKKKGKFELEEILNKKKKEIQHQEHEKQRLLDVYQTGALRLDEIEDRLKTIRRKISKIQEECSLLDREEKIKQDQFQLIEQFEEFKKRMNQSLSNLSFEDKKRVIKLLVSEVVVDVNKGEIVVRHIVPIGKSVPLCTGGKNAWAKTLSSRIVKQLKS